MGNFAREVGRGYPLLCKHIPTNPEEKEWRNMAYEVEPVSFLWSLLSSARNLSVPVTECLRKANDLWKMVVDGNLP